MKTLWSRRIGIKSLFAVFLIVFGRFLDAYYRCLARNHELVHPRFFRLLAEHCEALFGKAREVFKLVVIVGLRSRCMTGCEECRLHKNRRQGDATRTTYCLYVLYRAACLLLSTRYCLVLRILVLRVFWAPVVDRSSLALWIPVTLKVVWRSCTHQLWMRIHRLDSTVMTAFQYFAHASRSAK